MAVIIDQSGAIPVPVTPKNDESILRAVKGNISLDDVKDSKGRYAVSAVDFSHLSRVNLSTPQIASPSVVTFNGMPKQVTQVIHNNAGNGQLNVAPAGGVTSNLPHANQSTQTLQVISNNAGNGQLNVNPTGGVTSNLPHANQSTQTQQVIANVGGNGQLNVSPTGGVTNTLPYANHAPSITTTIVNTPDGNGSYLGHGVVFQPHIHANQIGWGHFIGDTSGDYVGNIADTTAKRFLHGAMSTGVQGVISSGSQLNVNPSGGVTNTLPYSNHDVSFRNVISSGSQVNVNPSGGVTGTLPYSNHDVSFRNVISSGSQVNVNPSGGVTGNLPYANHDVSVRTTLASTAGGDGSYLNTSQVFNRHLNSATQSGLADDATYLRWKQTQQTAILTNPGANHIVDPTFTSIADFWGNVGSASAGVLNQGALGVSGSVGNTNYDGRGNRVKVPLQQNDILVLQLTSTQAATGTADTYISAEFHQSDGTLISYANQAIVPSTGTATSVTTAPANTAYAYIFIQTYGGASGGNAALVTSPQARINHETVADAGAKKAYINANDTTSGGHLNLAKYASLAGLPDGIQVSASPVLDGGAVTFTTPFTGNTPPEILWLDGGVYVNNAYPLFTETFAGSAGNWTGFTASLKNSTLAGSVTNENLSFSTDSVTITVPGGDNVVGPGSFSVSGIVKDTSGEPNFVTITVTDTTHSKSWQKNVSVPANGTKGFTVAFTDTSAANGTVFTVGYSSGAQDSGNPTIAYQVQGSVTITSATPTGSPGINWIAFATS